MKNPPKANQENPSVKTSNENIPIKTVNKIASILGVQYSALLIIINSFTTLIISMIVQEVPVGKDEQSKKDLILKNLGKKVALVDFHNGYCVGNISKEYDGQTYHFRKMNGYELRLWYHDLEEFHLVKRYGVNPVPEGFVKYPLVFRIYTEKENPGEGIEALTRKKIISLGKEMENSLRLLSEME